MTGRVTLTEQNGNATECPHCGEVLGRDDTLCPRCGKPRSEARADRRAKVVPFRPRRRDPRETARTARGAPRFPTARQVRILWLLIFVLALLLPYLWHR
jgi:ribosomal protein L32